MLEGVLSESNPLAFVEVEAVKENKSGFVVFHFGAKGELRKSKTKDSVYRLTSAKERHFSPQ